MKLRYVVVAACVLWAVGAWAQPLSTRAAGMGGAAIGVADDAAAWYQNPAGLAALQVPAAKEDGWGAQAMFSYTWLSEDVKYSELNLSAWKPSERFGIGAGYGKIDVYSLPSPNNPSPSPVTEPKLSGIGFGTMLGKTNVALGVNVAHLDAYSDWTQLNAGLLWLISQGEGRQPIRLGVRADDVTGRDVTIWNAGLAWPITNNLLVAVDGLDLSEESGDVALNAGAEWRINGGNGRNWFVRVGSYDAGDENWWTAGVGYASQGWRCDIAYMDGEPDAIWSLGISKNF